MLKWKEEFTVGYDKFDNQHKEWIRIINKLEEVIKDDTIHPDILFDEVNNVFDEILDYTEFHFKNEEKDFEKSNYELIDEHKEIHEEFVANVKHEMSKFHAGEDERKTAKKIYDSLVEWLLRHIMGEDKKYSGKL
ncbi:MAG: bacteriohemerythrin [Bacillota bacterium]